MIAEGQWRGELLDAPQGAHGFGYDPLLWIASHGHSAAELDPAIKNAISHRALACQHLLALMRARWGLDGGAATSAWPWQH